MSALTHSFIHFWHAPLGGRSAKRRHQDPEWMIVSHISFFIHGEVTGFMSCWIVLFT